MDSEDEFKIYKDSALIIQTLGNVEIDGVTLKDYLRFKGVSLWDLIAPLFATHNLPEAILRNKNYDVFELYGNFYQKRIKSYLKTLWTYCFREARDSKSGKTPLFQEEEDNRTKVLYLCFEPRQIEDFAPVMNLLDKERFKIYVVGTKYRDNRYHLFDGTDRRFLAIEDFVTGTEAEIKEDRNILRRQLKRFKKCIPWSEINYNGISVRKFLKDDFVSLAVYTFPQLVREINIANRLISFIRPDIIVGADDCNPRQRIYFFLGRLNRIPTLVVQQGLANRKAVDWIFLSSDRIAVFGDGSKNILKEMGVGEEKIVITGQPRFDYLVKGANKKDEICRRFNIDSKKKVVLFTSQHNPAGAFPSERIRRQMISSIYDAVRDDGDFVLVVKPHPDERPGLHNRMVSKMNSKKVVLVERNANIHELILGSDVLITFHSTTAIEAMIAGKPVIIFNVAKRLNSVPYVENGTAVGVSSTEELVKTIDAIFNNNALQEKLRIAKEGFIGPHVRNSDGLASCRVCDLIIQMTKERQYEV